MKTKLILISLLLAPALISCGVTTTLKSNYRPATSIETTASYDEVWDRVVNFFAMNNLPINVLEKDSGIIAANLEFEGEPYITKEDKRGNPMNPDAFFVIPNVGKNEQGKVSFSFNVRVQKTEYDTIRIYINIGNIKGYRCGNYFYLTYVKWEEHPIECSSTGVLESKLLEIFK